MQRKDLKAFYEGRVMSLDSDIARLRQRNRIFIVAELATFVAAVGAVAAYTAYSGAWLIATALLMAAGYVAVRRADVSNGLRIDRLTAVRSVYANELSYLGGDFAPFDDGRRYADPEHPFVYDMDVFGPQSLFHRINRTVTTGGSDCLAQKLSISPDDDVANPKIATGQSNTDGMGKNAQATEKIRDFIEKTKQQHSLIDNLAASEALRTEFIACGHQRHIDTAAVLNALDTVTSMAEPRFAASIAVRVAAMAALAGFYVTVALAVLTPMSSGVPVIYGTLLLFMQLMLCNGPLRAISSSAGRLHKELKAYGELIGTVQRAEGLDFSDLNEALGAFASLRRLLDAFDRRGNVLGLILFDIFMLSDFMLVSNFFRWRRSCIGKMSGWIDRVSTIDALMSMATFRYNEPEAGHAEITDSAEVVYEAKGLWHPFLGARAVRNDFTVSDSHYYIVTGANMAGKSTFLRSLGVNYILAMNGMPVFAERLRVSVFSLFSSMRTTDDLAHGISYFNAELRRLQQLIDHCRRQRRTLIILDEILKGTNSLDKLNGSRMFLNAISRLPVTGIVATHDLELSRMADDEPDRFHNWCFEIKLSDKITYTYKITPGVARNQNATYLLRNILSF